MKVDLYTICQDSEELLPHCLNHYDPWVQRFFVYLNTATRDGTRELLESHPKVHVVPLETRGEFRDDLHRDMKNQAWKERRGEADWVVAVDDDEFLYHPQGTEEYLMEASRRGISVPEVIGFDMFSDVFPSPRTPITRQVVRGILAAHMNKRVGIVYCFGGMRLSGAVEGRDAGTSRRSRSRRAVGGMSERGDGPAGGLPRGHARRASGVAGAARPRGEGPERTSR